MPVSRFTLLNHGNPAVPTPSKAPGRVLGFHMPARNILMPWAARLVAVVKTCSSLSALQGPAIIIGNSGRVPPGLIGSVFNSYSISAPPDTVSYAEYAVT
jgi:hypothetical protein